MKNRQNMLNPLCLPVVQESSIIHSFYVTITSNTNKFQSQEKFVPVIIHEITLTTQNITIRHKTSTEHMNPEVNYNL